MTAGTGQPQLRYGVAQSASDFDMTGQLWRAVYAEERGWLNDAACDPFSDRYHSHSTYLLAICGDKAVGGLRVVRDSPEGLPIEQFFPLAPLKEAQRFVESQRLMVLEEYRHAGLDGAPFGLWAGLVKACIHYCFLARISHVLADVFTDPSTSPMVKKFKQLGFAQIGSPFIDYELGAPGESIALLLTVSQLLSRAYTSRDRFFTYLMSFDPAFEFYDHPGHFHIDAAVPQAGQLVHTAI
jgi:Acetyltransferase (GNAT) domain